MSIVSGNGTADLSNLSALSRDYSEERIAHLAAVAAAIKKGQYGVDAQALSARLVEEHIEPPAKRRS
jgi:anti-sigma28 factor (negative regulator of flagellin synthesis)